jgi:hypothetical protein
MSSAFILDEELASSVYVVFIHPMVTAFNVYVILFEELLVALSGLFIFKVGYVGLEGYMELILFIFKTL